MIAASKRCAGYAIVLIVALVLLAFPMAGSAAAPLDDEWCAQVKLPSSVVICSDPELRALAVERQQAFEAAETGLSPAQRKQLLADQNEWVKSYATACGVPRDAPPPDPVPDSVKACFKRAGEARIAYLRGYGAGSGRSAAAPAVPSVATASPPPISSATASAVAPALPTTVTPAVPAPATVAQRSSANDNPRSYFFIAIVVIFSLFVIMFTGNGRHILKRVLFVGGLLIVGISFLYRGQAPSPDESTASADKAPTITEPTTAEKAPSTDDLDKIYKQALDITETTLREKPWMYDFIRVLTVDVSGVPMSALSPAEKRCRQTIERDQRACPTEASCAPGVVQRDLQQCVADLREEWMSSH